MNSPILFITGTDTGVGKTLVTAALSYSLKSAGIKVAAAKPIETGCARLTDGTLEAADVKLLSRVLGAPALNIYRYPVPVAPQVAAQQSGEPIEIMKILRAVDSARSGVELLIMEGAGGLLVPITEDCSFADLAKSCGAHALVVVGSRLGAINHAALTFEVLRARNLPIVGYVINEVLGGEMDAARQTNRELLRSVAGGYEAAELASIPHLAANEPDSAEYLSEFATFCASPPIRQLSSAVINHFRLEVHLSK